MASPSKPKARDLERVRQNQQRSRERKRQYTASLERKIQELESRLHSKQQHNDCHDERNISDGHDDDDMKSRVAKLSHENRVRSELLCVLGIDKETQERFIRAASVRTEGSVSTASTESLMAEVADRLSESRAEPQHAESSFDTELPTSEQNLPPDPLTASASTTGLELFSPLPAPTSPQPIFDLNSTVLLSPQVSIGDLLDRLSADLLPSSTSTSLCTSCSTDASCCTAESASGSNDAAGSTACSIAFSMILQNNKRGYQLPDLESRMRAGYQRGSTPGEECRVLNKILFAVLAEIT